MCRWTCLTLKRPFTSPLWSTRSLCESFLFHCLSWQSCREWLLFFVCLYWTVTCKCKDDSASHYHYILLWYGHHAASDKMTWHIGAWLCDVHGMYCEMAAISRGPSHVTPGQHRQHTAGGSSESVPCKCALLNKQQKQQQIFHLMRSETHSVTHDHSTVSAQKRRIAPCKDDQSISSAVRVSWRKNGRCESVSHCCFLQAWQVLW